MPSTSTTHFMLPEKRKNKDGEKFQLPTFEASIPGPAEGLFSDSKKL
jgi:hypothetical protein